MPAVRATCEPCRLRRVKCDLREGRDQCTNCVKRDIQCPGVGVVATRKRRRGAVVDQVELEYGSGSISSQAASPNTSTISIGNSPAEMPASSDSSLLSLSHPSEQQLVKLELQSELVMSILASFSVSHGVLFRTISPGLYQEIFAKAGGRMTALDPTQEVMMRVMLTLGARTTMHPEILSGADLTSPHTLGIIREGPCRKLAHLALERYDQLGLWRECSLGGVQTSVTVSLVTSTLLDPSICSPLANAAVTNFRQYISSLPPSALSFPELLGVSSDFPEAPGLDLHLMTTGALVLWIDARNAAEMGSRPLITTDDLEDFPALRDWLHQPLDGTWRFRHLGAIMASHLNANQVRILREYAATFARPIRRNDLAALAALPQLWTEVTAFGLRLDVELERALPSIVECMQGQVGDATEEYNTRLYLNNLVQVTGSNCYIALSIYELLQRAVARTGQVDYLWPLLDALAHAKTQLKRVARLVKIIQMLGSGPAVWIHLVRLFVNLEAMPSWTQLLSGSDAGKDESLTEEECEILTEGVRLAGFGAGFAPIRWLDAMRARGITMG